MAKLNASRGGQYVVATEFTFNFDDTMVDKDGATKDFKTVGTAVFDVANLPVGAIVVNGSVTTEKAVGAAAAYNISIGDADNATRYLSATNRSAVGTSPLTATGYVSNGGKARMTVEVTTADATSGKVTVRLSYIIRNRVNEVQTH